MDISDHNLLIIQSVYIDNLVKVSITILPSKLFQLLNIKFESYDIDRDLHLAFLAILLKIQVTSCVCMATYIDYIPN